MQSEEEENENENFVKKEEREEKVEATENKTSSDATLLSVACKDCAGSVDPRLDSAEEETNKDVEEETSEGRNVANVKEQVDEGEEADSESDNTTKGEKKIKVDAKRPKKDEKKRKKFRPDWKVASNPGFKHRIKVDRNAVDTSDPFWFPLWERRGACIPGFCYGYDPVRKVRGVILDESDSDSEKTYLPALTVLPERVFKEDSGGASVDGNRPPTNTPRGTEFIINKDSADTPAGCRPPTILQRKLDSEIGIKKDTDDREEHKVL